MLIYLEQNTASHIIVTSGNLPDVINTSKMFDIIPTRQVFMSNIVAVQSFEENADIFYVIKNRYTSQTDTGMQAGVMPHFTRNTTTGIIIRNKNEPVLNHKAMLSSQIEFDTTSKDFELALRYIDELYSNV